MNTTAKARGVFAVTCRNADGSVAWTEIVENGNTLVGLRQMLDTMFNGFAASTNWYLGLISDAGFSAPTMNDTMSFKPWTEFQDYTGNRPAWGQNAAAGSTFAAVENTVYPTISITSSGTIRGLFVVNNINKGGTAGTLYSTGLLASPRALVAGQSLDIGYRTTLLP